MKGKNMALRVAGVIFLLIAIMHFLRLLLKIQIIVSGLHVRLLVSVVGFVIALLLALWMFAAASKKE